MAMKLKADEANSVSKALLRVLYLSNLDRYWLVLGPFVPLIMQMLILKGKTVDTFSQHLMYQTRADVIFIGCSIGSIRMPGLTGTSGSSTAG